MLFDHPFSITPPFLSHTRFAQLIPSQQHALLQDIACPDPHTTSHETYIACVNFILTHGCDVRLQPTLLDDALEAAFMQLEKMYMQTTGGDDGGLEDGVCDEEQGVCGVEDGGHVVVGVGVLPQSIRSMPIGIVKSG